MDLVDILDLEQERIIREAKDSVATPPKKIDAILNFHGFFWITRVRLPGCDLCPLWL